MSERCPGNTNRRLVEIAKTMKDLRIKFHKVIEVFKITLAEIKMELENSIIQLEKS